MIMKGKSVQFLFVVGIFLIITLIVLNFRLIPATVKAQNPIGANVDNRVFLPIVLKSQPVLSSLSPEVEAFISGTFLSHAAGYPDPNEHVQALKLYLDGYALLHQEPLSQVLQIFNQAVELYPESRHAHEGLALGLLQKYRTTRDRDYLRDSIDQFILADSIGMQYGRVHYMGQISEGLGTLQDLKVLESYFDKAINFGNEPYLTSLYYAKGLGVLGDKRAEEWYLKAMEFEPEGMADAVAYYAEWLLDHDRPEDVLLLVTDDNELEYAHFLKGVAFERLEQTQEAVKEYKKYQRINVDFPAPARFKISGSTNQTGITFENDVRIRANTSDAKNRFAQLIMCEAGAESAGGRRGVGWVIRTRVFRAYNAPVTCGWPKAAQNASLPDKYIAIINSGQFSPDCGTTPSAEINQVAAYVYDGSVPEPFNNWCPAGYPVGSTSCNVNGACSISTTSGANVHGAAWFGATSGSCSKYGPAGSNCATQAPSNGKTCGNGGKDNCFFLIK